MSTLVIRRFAFSAPGLGAFLMAFHQYAVWGATAEFAFSGIVGVVLIVMAATAKG
jgi:hypothetical protein